MNCPECGSINVSNHDETYYCYNCEHAWFPDEVMETDAKPVVVSPIYGGPKKYPLRFEWRGDEWVMKTDEENDQ